MPHPLWRRVEPVVAELDHNPLYRASGAAMELFHSNVLAWVLRSHPEASAPLAKLLGFTPADEYDVRREWRHLDLAIGVEGAEPGAVVENKITAMPDEGQLKRYLAVSEESSPGFAQRADFVLLSLLAPVFQLPEPWRRVDYGELSDAMQDVADRLSTGFNAEFTRQYAHLARLLADLVAAAGITETSTEPYYVDASTEALLQKAGVRDLVLKLRNVDLVQRVKARKTHQSGGWHEATWSQGRPIASHFTASAKLGGVAQLHLGWQLQGSQLRIVALMRDPLPNGKGSVAKAAREHAAQRHLNDWFGQDVRSFAPGRIHPYAGKLAYNHFEPDFIYRYGKVDPAITSDELVDALAAVSAAAETGLSALNDEQSGRAEGEQR